MNDVYALVMAGGRGTRFWPRSRRTIPKQCVALTGERTLLQETVDRLERLVPAERILVVTGPAMVDAVRAQVAHLPSENIMVEPSGRNTAPVVGWGAVEVARRSGGQAVMVVAPADHIITDVEEYLGVIQAAAEAARETNALVTLGVSPTRPETGYGYLEVGLPMGKWGGRVFHMVESFREKPDAETAARYLAEGRYLWNAGMFVFTADAVRDAFRHYLPRSAEALEEIQRNPERVGELWAQLDATSIDYGIMERSRHILTVPCEVGWSDVGSWSGIAERLPEVEGGRGLAGEVAAIDSSGCVVHAPGKLVALLGVHDLVVVDTGDALLVLHKDRAQEVRDMLAHLNARGLGRFT